MAPGHRRPHRSLGDGVTRLTDRRPTITEGWGPIEQNLLRFAALEMPTEECSGGENRVRYEPTDSPSSEILETVRAVRD